MCFEACWREDAAKRVRSGEVDLAVIVEGADTRGLHVAPYRHDRLAAVMRNDDALCGQTPLHFAELLERDVVGLGGGSTLTRLLEAQAAALLRPMALRVQVRSFEAVCRTVEAKLGIGVLPLAAARSFAGAMGSPLVGPWATRTRISIAGCGTRPRLIAVPSAVLLLSVDSGRPTRPDPRAR